MTRVLVALVSLVVAAVAAAPGASRADAPALTARDALERAVLVEINALRLRHGLRPLRVNARLAAAAESHSVAMATHGFFAHDSRDGTAFWKRIARFYKRSGRSYWSVGENLLWASPDVDAQAALQTWLRSPPHRRNLLTRRWREIGLSAVHADVGGGVYGGRPVTVLTADFGVRR